MSESQKSYRQVFKATSLFGGVQVFNILIGLIRSKFVAILLGTTGYGISGLFNSPLGFITNLTGLGIGFSAIRDIAQAYESGDEEKMSQTLTIFRRWVWLTGILGMLTTIVLAPWLSEWTFGNKDYTWEFIYLSITLLLGSISSGQMALLRGTRKLKETAKSSLTGGILGLFSSIPLYYLYGIKGIVPALIVASVTTLFLSWWYSRKIKIFPVSVSLKETWAGGFVMVKLGIMMTLTGLIGSGVSYLVNAFISNKGGISEVGLYNAGWGITNQYVSLVFAAMAADYYPRLAGIQHDNKKLRDAVNQQAEVAVLIIAPIMILYLSSLPILIPLIYSSKFLEVIPFTQWVVLGMILKATSWTLGFIILAKGDTKLFFVTELTSNILLLATNLGGYHVWGLEGIGIAFVLLYFFYLILLLIIVRKKYEFTFSKEFKRIFNIQYLISIVAFIFAFYWGFPYAYVTGGILLITSIFYSFNEINKRLDIKSILFKSNN